MTIKPNRHLPILFQDEMVRAILAGTKTQTRRLVKPQPPASYSWGGVIVGDQKRNGTAFWRDPNGRSPDHDTKPRYATNDTLWVREAWSGHNGESYIYKPQQFHHDIFYRTDNDRPTWASGAWRPSIFMPQWASRLNLQVTAVRTQRIQDISPADCIAEGIPNMGNEPSATMYREAFARLWNKINGRPKPHHATINGRKTITHYTSYPWSHPLHKNHFIDTHRGLPHHIHPNPWVFAYTFEAINE